MKKKLVLLMVSALMLSGCTLLDFTGSSEGGELDPEDAAYRPTVVIKEEQKGEEITVQEAQETVVAIQTATQSRSQKLQTLEGQQEVAEETTVFSYDFKVKMDDYYVLDSVDYSKNDKYFHSALHAEIPAVDLSKTGYTVDGIDVVEGSEDIDYHLYQQQEAIIEAQKVIADGYYIDNGVRKSFHENDKRYHTLKTDSSYEELALPRICNEMLFIGNQSNAMMQQAEPYLNEQYASLGANVSFHSKGEGHLYMEVSMPTMGLEMTALFENYWLTYEYMHIDLRKISAFMEEEIPYERMTTELNIDFTKCNVEYPDLSQYTEDK